VSIYRKSPLLNDALEALDHRLALAKQHLPKSISEEQTAYAWTLLSALELDFIREELDQCIASRIYYLETYHCIIPESGQIKTLAGLWDHQLQVEEALEKEIQETGQGKIIVLKPRQAGITEYATGVMCWRTFFLPYAYTISVAQDPSVAAHIQRKVNGAYDHLPWWMRPERQYHNKGEYIEYNRKALDERSTDPGLGSVYVTTHAARDTGVAIGKTVRSAHFSEVSRWPSGEIYTADIEPSMNASDTVAICESTALGTGNFFHRLWQEAEAGDSDWTPVFLPVYRAKKFSLPIKPAQQPFTLTEAEQAIRERVQLEEGFQVADEFFNWRRKRVKSAIARTGYPYAHYESYPLTAREAFQSSGYSVFPRHKLDEMAQTEIRRPVWVGEIAYQGLNAAPKLLLNNMLSPDGSGYLDIRLERREHTNRLYLWELPDPRFKYYIGSDIADGNGGDFSVAEIFRAGTVREPDVQVGEWVGWEQPVAFARVLYALGTYYNRCEIAVEYAKEGMTTANYLMNDMEYPNLYRPRARDRIKATFASFMHWQTTSRTKPLLVTTMNEALLEGTVIIRSQYLLDEMYAFSRDGSGYSGLNSHDDSVMAGAICVFCLRETLPEMRPMTGQAEDGKNLTPTAGARATGGAVIYGLYDQFMRLLKQTRNLQEAERLAAEHSWHIKPIRVTKANTAFSPIHHGSGLEGRMYREYGVDPWGITPTAVSLFREASQGRGAQPPLSGREGLTAEEMNEQLMAGVSETDWD
jgi:hypothetical protein